MPVIVFIMTALLVYSAAVVFAAVSEEDKYDSMQWYLKGKYLFEHRKDAASAHNALIKACELDFDNAEAFAYIKILEEKAGIPAVAKFSVTIPEYKGGSGAAKRWFANAVDAFQRGDYEGALFCATNAAKQDPADEQLSYMVNVTAREKMLHIIKANLEKKFTTVDHAIEGPEASEPSAHSSEDLPEAYLSIKTASGLLAAGKKEYDPAKFSEWLGFAKYIYNTKKDPRNAKLALDAALLFYSSNEVALSLKNELEKKIKEEEALEKKRVDEIKAAEERDRLRRIEEERNKRSSTIREIVIDDPKKKKKPEESVITGDFSIEDFLEDTSSVEPTAAGTVEVERVPHEELKVLEISLANDVRPSQERKNLVEEVKGYVTRHSKIASEHFSTGKLHESLLEYEKIYHKILELDGRDIKSLYNLVLIYKKMGEQRNAQETFIKLLKAINETSARYSGSRQIRAICNFADCTIKASIVNAAVLAYNKKNYFQMNRSNFDISKLREKGYIVLNDEEDRTVTMEIVENSLAGGTSISVKYSITCIKCLDNGKYGIGENGVIKCGCHGDNAIILTGQETDRIGN